MSEERDYEKEALADGWNPDFDGPSKKDAKTFVEDGEKISGMLKAKVGRLEERVNSLTNTNAEFAKYTERQHTKDRQENERLIGELDKVRAQAITDGDGIAAVKAEQEIRTLQTEPQVDPQKAIYDQMAQKWAADSEWYGSNKKLTAMADGIAEGIAQQGYTGAAYFKELDRQMKEMAPEEFENPKRSGAQSVEAGGNKEVADSKAHTWANLPPEDKKTANRFIKDMPGFTKEKFLDQYEWSE